MTQLTDAGGRAQAVTVIQLGPCFVTQLKSEAKDGYEAVQVTYGRKKPARIGKAERGHFAQAKVAPGLATREFAPHGPSELSLGQSITVADVFKLGDMVDVSGVSKGHGYAGVIKRHGFAGFPASRGTHEYFRHGGSIGNRSFPGRVRKGLRMAGQMGNEKVGIANLRVVEILPEEGAIVLAGSVPGADGSIVVVRHAAKTRGAMVEGAAIG